MNMHDGDAFVNCVRFLRISFQLRAAKDCHCERSEAISALKARDCFVVSLLAMTEHGKIPFVSEGMPEPWPHP